MDFYIYIYLAPITALIMLITFFITLKYFKERVAKFLLTFQLSVLFFILFNYLEVLSQSYSLMIRFAHIEHLFLLLTSISWFYFSLSYTGYERTTDKIYQLVIAVVSIFHIIILFTDNIHHKFYSSVGIIGKFGLTEIRATYGPFFWSLTFFDYLLLGCGVIVIVVSYIKGESYYRKQAIWIILSFLFPLISNCIYIFRIFPDLNKDYSSVSFAFSGIFLFIGMFFYRFLQVTPIARSVVFKDLQDVIIILDKDLKIIDFNDSAKNVFNINKNHIGVDIDDSELKYFMNNIRQVNIKNPELTFGSKFKESIYDIYIKNLYTQRGDLQAVLIRMVDVSDKMNLIFELEETNNRLEKMQVQLIQNEKMATLGLLSAGVAHEINNPLSYIKSNYSVISRYLENIENLCVGEDSDKKQILKTNIDSIKDIVSDTGHGVLRINEVVQYLLGFSRNNPDNKFHSYNINDGIKKTLSIANNYISDKAKINLNLGEVPNIKTSGNEINQVILNLLTNSAHAIPQNMVPGLIEVTTFTENGYLVMEITDNGEEILPENREKIFLPFYTSKTEKDGTGLGLSISRNIIEKNFYGKLYIKNSEIKTFRLEVKIDNEDEVYGV